MPTVEITANARSPLPWHRHGKRWSTGLVLHLPTISPSLTAGRTLSFDVPPELGIGPYTLSLDISETFSPGPESKATSKKSRTSSARPSPKPKSAG